MALQLALLTQDNSFLVSCPFCNRINRISFADLGNTDRMLKVFGMNNVYFYQCLCGRKFNLKLDLRKKLRQKLQLPGHFVNLASLAGGQLPTRHDKYYYGDENPLGSRQNCEVVELSVLGIRVKIMVKHHIQVGDSLMVKFDLGGDRTHRIIEKTMQVMWIKKDLIGGEFSQKDKNDPRIGFFLM